MQYRKTNDDLNRNTTESHIESYFKDTCAMCGFLPLKFRSPGQNGVPDQEVITKHGTVYVELKSPGKKPRPLQMAVMKKMTNHGATCLVIDDYDKTNYFCDVLLEPSKRGIKSRFQKSHIRYDTYRKD